jgi:hypothetical protein
MAEIRTIYVYTILLTYIGSVLQENERRAVLRIRIRIHWIQMFLGLPDPLVRGMGRDPSIIMQN